MKKYLMNLFFIVFSLEILIRPFLINQIIESECGTLLYCFATYLDYVMRFDGGIAVSYTSSFFYVIKEFII